LLKEPSVTFVDTISGAGKQVEGHVLYLEDGIVVEFDEPVTGRILLN
jgi:hypothetical protein